MSPSARPRIGGTRNARWPLLSETSSDLIETLHLRALLSNWITEHQTFSTTAKRSERCLREALKRQFGQLMKVLNSVPQYGPRCNCPSPAGTSQSPTAHFLDVARFGERIAIELT